MANTKQNTVFTKEHYENEIHLEVNQDVLKRIYSDGIEPTDQLPVNFFFVTDTEDKATLFRDYLCGNYPQYTEIEVWDYDEHFEIRGFSSPVLMEIEAINQWNQIMWDAGYQYDCILDGWEVEGR
ncbi:ribonuclease E inhibitor RraB [Mucilaginibacter paludis]|uniref:Regulator of ribonuclease activity B domain-containing protein n=1 Tax=Mucilaginibacter paludis DSM 18603 TaxID=714943 RepID=H1Y9H0_9SPHI|nr:ribonuclease E inhibitor RraB [Mucilaginibacter paludis]EHQ29975.1 hypothetical protein Mucpa_5910 [Mucilaginibacter paludis DSM 18603]